ncbi:hypothetical protein V1264_009490 [Littorina saxatilis]
MEESENGIATAALTANESSAVAAAAADGDSGETAVKREVTEAKVEVLSHGEIMHVVKDTLAGLISNDPLLKDLHPYVTLEEVNSMIALEYGQAMVVNVVRGDGDVMPVVVKQDATLLDLKHGVKRLMTLQLLRSTEGAPAINWRYIWKHYWLFFNGEKLSDDNKLLKECGIRNRDEVTFMKRLRER